LYLGLALAGGRCRGEGVEPLLCVHFRFHRPFGIGLRGATREPYLGREIAVRTC
jgi:hypothetical protein